MRRHRMPARMVLAGKTGLLAGWGAAAAGAGGREPKNRVMLPMLMLPLMLMLLLMLPLLLLMLPLLLPFVFQTPQSKHDARTNNNTGNKRTTCFFKPHLRQSEHINSQRLTEKRKC